jgi:hypothetical protein
MSLFHTTRPCRPLQADLHTDRRADIVAAYQAAARAAATAPESARNIFLAGLLDAVTDTDVLIAAGEHVSRHGGPGAGVDGVSPAALTRADVIKLARALQDEVRSGRYRPGPDRQVEVPKRAGGVRVLSVPGVADRVLQKAVLMMCQPFVDALLPEGVIGGRPGMAVTDAINAAGRAAGTGDRWCWALADARAAFDTVPLVEMAASIRRWFGSTPFADLLVTIATHGRELGIRQGSPLSPIFLNIFLTDVLDGPWAIAHPDQPLVRWVDDLLVLTRTPKEAHDALDHLSTLLALHGMRLKPGARTADLTRGSGIEWLGVELHREGNTIAPGITQKEWARLRQDLLTAQGDDHPTERARTIIRGWIGTNRISPLTTTYQAEVIRAIEEAGFSYIANKEEIAQWWSEAHEKSKGGPKRRGETKGKKGNESRKANNTEGKTFRAIERDAQEEPNATAPRVAPKTAFAVPSADGAAPSSTPAIYSQVITRARRHQPAQTDSRVRVPTPTSVTPHPIGIVRRPRAPGRSPRPESTGDPVAARPPP